MYVVGSVGADLVERVVGVCIYQPTVVSCDTVHCHTP